MEYTHELIMPNDDIPFKLFLFEGSEGNYARARHWHRSVEIFALFEGELEFFVNETGYRLKPGEFMLVNSNEIHSIHAPQKNETVVLQIPLSAFEKYYTDEHFIYFTHSSKVCDEEVMHLIRDIYDTYQKRLFGYELKVQGQFFMLLYLLVTKYRETRISADQIQKYNKLNKLSNITAYIRNHYTKDLSLENLAKTFGYSPTYLSKMFQKYAQMNYKSFVDDVRVEHAYRDLRNTKMPIGEIALANGFPNSKAFAKVFREKYGMMPSEYRKRQMNEKDKNLP